MINFFVEAVTQLNNITGNLGVTILLIAVVSRLIFYPLTRSSVRQSQKMRDMKPRLDELKRKHGNDRKKLAEEQARIYKESGVSAFGCLAPLVQVAVAFILFSVLLNFLRTDVATHFLIWDLAKPDTYEVAALPFRIPGLLVVLTALATFIQSKMTLPAPVHEYKSDSPKEKEEKQDLSSALSASQGQMVFLFPFLILFTGTLFPSGLALYWTSSTLIGIIQQYQIAGWGGLEPWIKRISNRA